MDPEPHPGPTRSPLPPGRAWDVLLRIVERIRTAGPVTKPVGIQICENTIRETLPSRGPLVLDPRAPRGWSAPPTYVAALPVATQQLLNLYMPLCVGAKSTHLVVAHLAQSLDGRVATTTGASQFISGREDLAHTHRLRALFDAVVVGARTVEHDDPRLTTRLASGPNPTRVIVDPRGRLSPDHRVFTQTEAPTLIIRGRGTTKFPATAHASAVELEASNGWIAAPDVLQALADRGLNRVFIEGGGVTVSRFIQSSSLDRLHITVAPILLGSGRPSVLLPEISALSDALRTSCQHFPLGSDLLFDCTLPQKSC